MKLYNLNSYIFKQSISDHESINDKLLSFFKDYDIRNYKFGNTINITKTDWDTSKDMNKPYVSYFIDKITPYLNNVSEKLMTKKCKINDIWFQQYNENDNHGWHNPSNCNWSNVYFVELPDNSVATKFKDKDIDIDDIKTGDMITFPGYLLHESPKNLSGKRKTIISFNSNYSDYTEH